MNRNLPLTVGGKWYDIAYVAGDGEVFLVEVMRARFARGPMTLEDGSPWRKR